MLEKNAFKVLGVIAELSTEGENLVVEKDELIKGTGLEMTVDELDRHIDGLELNDMISVRYADANLCCVAMRPKGKLVAEKNRREEAAMAIAREAEPEIAAEEETAPEERTFSVPANFKLMAVICGAASFLGGMIAAIVAFLIARFG